MFRRSLHEGGAVERFHMARAVVGPALKVTTCYRAGPFLVDTGIACRATALRSALRGRVVQAALLTHGHEDHAGNVGTLRAQALGARGLRIAQGIPLYRKVAWGEPRPGPVGDVGRGVEGGGVELVPVPTPGHTPDHLAYWEPSRGWLFTGDAALGPLRYGFRDEDLGAYMASLRALRDRKPAVVFPAHGPVLDRPVEQLGAQLARLEDLGAQAAALAREGLGEAAIARRLLGPDGLLGRISGGEFRKALLIRGLLRARGAAQPGPGDAAPARGDRRRGGDA